MVPSDPDCVLLDYRINVKRMTSEPSAVLLLTACVNPPAGLVITRRTNQNTRWLDYQRAIRFWCRERLIQRLVFVENSGFPAVRIKQVIERHRHAGLDFEVISAPRSTDPVRGKSLGELLMLEHALETSRLLSEPCDILKVSGRYLLTNFHRVWPRVDRLTAPTIMVQTMPHDGYCDSRVFLASKQFMTEYLFERKEMINDSSGRYFEHALAAAIDSALRDGHAVIRFPGGGFVVDGIQASLDRPFEYPFRTRVIHRTLCVLRGQMSLATALRLPWRSVV